jgi:hypothetical protein
LWSCNREAVASFGFRTDTNHGPYRLRHCCWYSWCSPTDITASRKVIGNVQIVGPECCETPGLSVCLSVCLVQHEICRSDLLRVFLHFCDTVTMLVAAVVVVVVVVVAVIAAAVVVVLLWWW